MGIVQSVSTREVYPNAPIVLVAAEVRHAKSAPLTDSQVAVLKRHLRDEFPLLKTLTQTQVLPFAQATQTTARTFPRFVNRERTSSVTFQDEAVVYETTRYAQFEHLQAVMERALSALAECQNPDGLERVGLRYIDEIRAPEDPSGPLEWAEWVDSSLIGPACKASRLDVPAEQWQGQVVFRPSTEDSLVLRYGSASGYAIDPQGELTRTSPPPGPFFLLDIDSFWMPLSLVPEFNAEHVLAHLARLHDPVRNLFESLVTDRLRDEVFRYVK